MDTTDTNKALAQVLARLDAIDARLDQIVDRQKKSDELFSEMTPILRDVMGTATTRLDELDKKGYFAFGREALGVADRVITGFAPEDVRQLGDAVVGILQTVRALTQPNVLEIASQASEVLEKSDQAEPLGLLGMVRATRDDDVQKGMAVMMDVMRHVGRAARAVRDEHRPSAADEKKAKLAGVLGPRKKKALGVERQLPPTVAPRAAAPANLGPPAACAVPSSKPREVAAVIDGVAFGADGHLVDPKVWTEEIAVKVAAVQGVELDESRWAVVRFARADFVATNVSPNIRRITQGTSLATKDIYTLFPKAPARTIARIAGIPKPAGCI